MQHVPETPQPGRTGVGGWGGCCTYVRATRSHAPQAASLTITLSAQAASLCSGRNFWQLKGIPRLGLESVSVADGPHGLRCQEDEADHLGMGASLPATCFPTAVTLAGHYPPLALHPSPSPHTLTLFPAPTPSTLTLTLTLTLILPCPCTGPFYL